MNLAFDFDAKPAREMAPASLEQFDRILPTLNAREREVFLALCDVLAATGQDDATGGEVAEHDAQRVLLRLESVFPQRHTAGGRATRL